MLVDLKHPLAQGKVFEATLQFEKAGTVKIEFPIAAIGAAAPGTPAGAEGHMMEGHGGMMHMTSSDRTNRRVSFNRRGGSAVSPAEWVRCPFEKTGYRCTPNSRQYMSSPAPPKIFAQILFRLAPRLWWKRRPQGRKVEIFAFGTNRKS